MTTEPSSEKEASVTNDSSTELKRCAPSARLEKTTANLPIVTGSIAFYLGNKGDEFQTHEWTLYVRGPRNEDLSVVISRVVFHLHPSFQQSVRELTKPPYEVTERGWGEFDAQIKIDWKDPSEQATLINQPIKLYPPGAPANVQPTDTETPVIYENYDEIVFTDPTETFFRQLRSVARAPTVKGTHDAHFRDYDDSDDMKVLLEAKKFIQEELALAKERLAQVDSDLIQVDEALRQQHEHRKAATNSSRPAVARPKATSANRAPAPASKKSKTN